MLHDPRGVVAVNGYVVKVDGHWQVRTNDLFHHSLEMGRSLGQSKWHAQPPELSPVADEGAPVAAGGLELDVMESGLQVDKANVSMSR